MKYFTKQGNISWRTTVFLKSPDMKSQGDRKMERRPKIRISYELQE